jgi:hypothetical protein
MTRILFEAQAELCIIFLKKRSLRFQQICHNIDDFKTCSAYLKRVSDVLRVIKLQGKYCLSLHRVCSEISFAVIYLVCNK